MTEVQQDSEPQDLWPVDPVTIFSGLWCGSAVGILTGTISCCLVKRIVNVRRDAVLRGRTPPSIISLIPQELWEMIKKAWCVFNCLFAMAMNGVHGSIRRLRPAPVRRPFWPGSLPADQQERLPTSTPYYRDAGMRSGSTRDFRSVLPSHNQHLVESQRPPFEDPRPAPEPPDHVEAAAAKFHKQPNIV